MARRSKSKHRREPQKDPLEALRPLIVLGLLGMILYGAYSIIQKGPKETDQAWQNSESSSAAVSEAPPFVPSVPTPPSVDLQSPSESLSSIPDQQANPSPAPLTSQSLAQEQPRALPSEQMPPTYIEAVAAIPPQSQAPQAETGSITKDTSTQTASAAFTAAWTDAHNKLEAGRYAEALAVLSVWHDDSSLSVEENHQLERLLGQLAGTVIYSTQDMLLPPHTVAAGETLETIAKPLNIPWELLSKINGLESDTLTTGQRIKVLRGPFDAVVSVSRRRLSLQVGGRYAGTFPAAIGKGFIDRTGSSVQLLEIQTNTETQAPRAGSVSYRSANQVAIILSDGLRIQPAVDPSFVTKDPEDSVLLVSSADFNDLVGILGQGSQLLVQK